jgi:hypothetical protein
MLGKGRFKVACESGVLVEFESERMESSEDESELGVYCGSFSAGGGQFSLGL